MFLLISTLVCVVLGIVDSVPGFVTADGGSGLLSGLYTLLIFIPGLAVAVRRLHDTGRSAWWLLLLLVPLGFVAVLVFLATDSDPGTNVYGENPNHASA